MQCLYASDHNEAYQLPSLEQFLQKSILYFEQLYLYHWLTVERIVDHVKSDRARRQKKHIKTEADKKWSEIINQNPIPVFVRTNKDFLQTIKQAQIVLQIEDDVTRKLYQNFTNTHTYQLYSQKTQHTAKEQTDIMRFLLVEILQKDELYQSHLEDVFFNYYDDIDVIYPLLVNQLNNFFDTSGLSLLPDREAVDDRLKFGRELLAKTLQNADTFKQLIVPQLHNWDPDRVNSTDNVLLRMALCELLYFPNIPVKVSINEYVDISKQYSTPKSKEFVNGVLDKLMKKLTNEGKIKKIGRGVIGF